MSSDIGAIPGHKLDGLNIILSPPLSFIYPTFPYIPSLLLSDSVKIWAVSPLVSVHYKLHLILLN